MPRLCFFLVLSLFLASCAATQPEEGPREVGVVEAEGVVEYVELEGGFYGITTVRGARFFPVDLPEEFQQAGLEVRFRGRVQENLVTIQMWGTPITVEWMEAL